MRSGGGKAKGSSYERETCKKLSLWVSNGQRVDLFWRSAMSGGRATVARRKGVDIRQGGDITAVAPEGHVLTNRFYLELKHYKSLDLEAFVFKGTGTLANFWRTAAREAKAHNRLPLMIVRQNRLPDLLLCRPGAFANVVESFPKPRVLCALPPPLGHVSVWYLDTILNCPFVGAL